MFGLEKPRSGLGPGPGTGTGTGDLDRTRWGFWTFPSATMVISDEEEDWKSVSGDDDGHPERHVDDVIILETSATGDSSGSISFCRRETRTTLLG